MPGVGAVVIVSAVVLMIAVRGWEFASWVAAVIGALVGIAGLVMSVRNAGDQGGTPRGDEIKQRNVKAGRDVYGKRGGSADSLDEVEQEDIEAGQDVYGKHNDPGQQ